MDENRTLKDDYERAEAGSDAATKDFVQEEVANTDEFELFMEQSFLGLSRSQFKNQTGKLPEDAGLKLADLPLVTTEACEKGMKVFKGLLVVDPGMPYTRYILRRKLGVGKRKVLMATAKHLYPRQARVLRNHDAIAYCIDGLGQDRPHFHISAGLDTKSKAQRTSQDNYRTLIHLLRSSCIGCSGGGGRPGGGGVAGRRQTMETARPRCDGNLGVAIALSRTSSEHSSSAPVPYQA